MAPTMFLKKICLILLIATSITQSVKAGPIITYSDFWKKQSTIKKKLAQKASNKNKLTQKPLIVQIQIPNFLREGDRIELSAKVTNFSDHELTGTTQLIVWVKTT